MPTLGPARSSGLTSRFPEQRSGFNSGRICKSVHRPGANISGVARVLAVVVPSTDLRGGHKLCEAETVYHHSKVHFAYTCFSECFDAEVV